jgi:hypothetical protein
MSINFLLTRLYPELHHNVYVDLNSYPCEYTELTGGERWDTSFGTVLSDRWMTEIHKKREREANRRKGKRKTKEKIRKKERFVDGRK